MLTTEKKYQAFVNKEENYDGEFYIAVKTTGIFCRTVCTAKKAKHENVQFYDTIQEALAAGYRPCKICRPMESIGKIPEEIQALINEVEIQPNFKIQEWQLRERGFDPNTLRRWFQKQYGMSFQAFCRMYRINAAFGAIKDGTSILDAALECGYESSSGFSTAYEKIIGSTPRKTSVTAQEVLVYKRFDTPLGPMIAIASSLGLCLLEFGDRRMLETEFKDLSKRLKAVIVPGHNIYTDQAITQILAYFEGTKTTFTVQLHTPGTDFQNTVWRALQNIPFGETTSYNELAKRIMNPKAVRAVGRANGMNRIAIIIPCHRVIGSDGELTGYGGGLWRKEWLIKHEAGL